MPHGFISWNRITPQRESRWLDPYKEWKIEYSIGLFVLVIFLTIGHVGFMWSCILGLLSTPLLILVHAILLCIIMIIEMCRIAVGC